MLPLAALVLAILLMAGAMLPQIAALRSRSCTGPGSGWTIDPVCSMLADFVAWLLRSNGGKT